VLCGAVLCCSSPSTDAKKKAFEESTPNDEIEALIIARALVSVLNHSTQVLDKLKEIQVQRNVDENALGLTNDVENGWWSTYIIIDRMLNLKFPIRNLYYEELDDDTRKDVSVLAKCHLTKDDWECLDNVRHVLEPFKEGQKICDAQKYVVKLLPLPQHQLRAHGRTDKSKRPESHPTTECARACVLCLKT
jgi:hypothetical protein